jgi:hypothetical protein
MWRATVRQGAQACQVNYVSQSVYSLGVGVLDFSTSKHSSLQRLRLNILTNHVERLKYSIPWHILLPSLSTSPDERYPDQHRCIHRVSGQREG